MASLSDFQKKLEQVRESLKNQDSQAGDASKQPVKPKKSKKPTVVLPNASKATPEQLKALEAFSQTRSNAKVSKKEPAVKPKAKKAEKPKSQPKPIEVKPQKPAEKQPVKKQEVKKQVTKHQTQSAIRNQPVKLELPENLPITQKAEEIREAIKNNQVIIVCGETGSGKTTQLPKICMQLGRGQTKLIGHTQPRRIAATSIAKRIAEETGTKVGEVVGYQIRFKDEMEPGASIKLMTDGIMLTEIQSDPLLKKYDTIIIDEAHERSLNIDFLLGYLKEILPKRQDLKLIITSATIDSERFAKHFQSVNKKEVPVINVSGRLYPVEIRYQPIQVDEEDEEEESDLFDAIADACEQLLRNGRGDILVFLPGEREIREAADVINGIKLPGIEVLPLFSRLTMEEQDRIFHLGASRRIILSTNIAETSVTVPGIRYVVDTGLARVKRYSYRNKVEQLQIEPISQAAAKQRSGRCGRVANGICIRLYDEADFKKRAEFTDPEILRSSLATVILRMKALHLTDVQDFPFVEPPLPKAITDGYDLLIELNAVTSRRGDLTAIGKELTRLPVDVKVARMLQAANQNQALSEMLIIASAISIQDPRDRPLESQNQADQAHQKFADEKSDFQSFLKMWNYVQELNQNKESNRLMEKELRKNFLSPHRLREWRDVYRQLRELVLELGWRINTAEATYEQLHKSLLAGLLGNIGSKIEDADWRSPPYAGARGIKFWQWPGSYLTKKPGKWIVSAEIVETSRLYARTIANIDSEWLEKVGAHLIKKSWAEPHWEKTSGQVIAFESGTLYGLPVYGQRKVPFAERDPKGAREIFIRSALIERDFTSSASFWRHNTALIREIEEMEQKSRRLDVLVDDESIFNFYDRLLGEEVCSSATLDKWLAKAQKENPKVLYMTKEQLMLHDASGITIEYFPKKIEVAGVPMALDYNFDPGSPRDGVTITVPIFALNQIHKEQMEWLVPGMVKEKVQSLLKSLPQRYRRHFVPLPDWAKKFAYAHERPKGSIYSAIIEAAKDEFGFYLERSDFKLEQVPPHLFMNYKVVDEHGRQLGMSRSLDQLRSELSAQASENFQAVASQDTKVYENLQEEFTDWVIGDLPEIMEINRKGLSFIGHPAIVDKGQFCSLEVFDDPQKARELHLQGLRKLIRFRLKEQIKYLEKQLNSLQTSQIIGAALFFTKQAFSDFDELKNEVINASIDQIALSEKLPTTEKEFIEICNETKGKLNLLANEKAHLISQTISEANVVNQKLNSFKQNKELYSDISSQLENLFSKRFIENIPSNILKHFPRYLKAIQIRLDRYSKDPARDSKHADSIRQLAIPLQREIISRSGFKDEQLEEFKYLLEELRVSLFAQELKTPVPVSVKRLTKIWESIPKNKN